MSGNMPDVCRNCSAFLVEGRPDCPFCGSTGGSAPAPRPAFQPQPGQLPGAGTHGGSASTVVLKAVIGLCVIVLAAFVVNHGRAVDRAKAAEAAEAGSSETVSSTKPTNPKAAALLGVCADDPEPIAEAASYKAGPGPHYVEMMILQDLGDGFRDEQYWSGVVGGGYYGDLQNVHLSDVELVACFHVTESTYLTRCELTTFGSNARVVSEAFYATSGQMEVREAKTGKHVQTNHVPANEDAPCPDWGSTGHHLTDVPFENADAILRMTLNSSKRPAS